MKCAKGQVRVFVLSYNDESLRQRRMDSQSGEVYREQVERCVVYEGYNRKLWIGMRKGGGVSFG